uniref:uncharacterized protein LOC101309545 isoform X2 n=1 Tax=Fragaria vesca subsp. vesca TaxID=101020 RepID=UPI0005CA5638|nr:PREDICTED: uncharacterized protein LOC101309545 isoform X2 [Fragaria vesca subsp. vesca]
MFAACGMQFPIKDKDLKKEVRDCESLHKEFPNIEVVVRSFCDTLIRRSQNTPFIDDILKDFMDYMITFSCHLPVGYNKTVIWMTFQTIYEQNKLITAWSIWSRKQLSFIQGQRPGNSGLVYMGANLMEDFIPINVLSKCIL